MNDYQDIANSLLGIAVRLMPNGTAQGEIGIIFNRMKKDNLDDIDICRELIDIITEELIKQ